MAATSEMAPGLKVQARRAGMFHLSPAAYASKLVIRYIPSHACATVE